MQASVPVVDWVYQSSAACLDTLSQRPPHAMRISITTRFDAHRKQLLDESRARSKVRTPPQLWNLPKDELHNALTRCATRTRSAQSIRASGTSAASTGRTRDRTRPMLQKRQ